MNWRPEVDEREQLRSILMLSKPMRAGESWSYKTELLRQHEPQQRAKSGYQQQAGNGELDE